MRFRLSSQWGAVFACRRFNWIGFTFIDADFDYDKMSSRVRLIFALLGINLLVTIPVGAARKKTGKFHLRMRDLDDRGASGGNFLSIEEARERLRQNGIELDFQVPEALIEELEQKRLN